MAKKKECEHRLIENRVAQEYVRIVEDIYRMLDFAAEENHAIDEDLLPEALRFRTFLATKVKQHDHSDFLDPYDPLFEESKED